MKLINLNTLADLQPNERDSALLAVQADNNSARKITIANLIGNGVPLPTASCTIEDGICSVSLHTVSEAGTVAGTVKVLRIYFPSPETGKSADGSVGFSCDTGTTLTRVAVYVGTNRIPTNEQPTYVSGGTYRVVLLNDVAAIYSYSLPTATISISDISHDAESASWTIDDNTELDHYTYSIDSGESSDTTTPTAPLSGLSEGSHSIMVTAVDNRNSTITMATASFESYITPVVTITDYAIGDTKISWAINSEYRLDHYAYKIDTDEYVATNDAEASIEILADGSHTITVNAYAADNTVIATAQSTFNKYTKATISINEYAEGDETITWIISDESQCTGYVCTIDGNEVTATGNSVSLDGIEDGTHTIVVTATGDYPTGCTPIAEMEFIKLALLEFPEPTAFNVSYDMYADPTCNISVLFDNAPTGATYTLYVDDVEKSSSGSPEWPINLVSPGEYEFKVECTAAGYKTKILTKTFTIHDMFDSEYGYIRWLNCKQDDGYWTEGEPTPNTVWVGFDVTYQDSTPDEIVTALHNETPITLKYFIDNVEVSADDIDEQEMANFDDDSPECELLIHNVPVGEHTIYVTATCAHGLTITSTTKPFTITEVNTEEPTEEPDEV